MGRDRQRGRDGGLRQRAEDAAGRIFRNFADGRQACGSALELARLAPLPFLHGDDLGGQDRPAGSGQELAGLRVTDAVTQRAERAGGWVNIRDGPDARQAVADGDPQLAAIRLQGRQQIQTLAVPIHGQGHGAICLGDAVLQLLAGMHRNLIDGKNTVPGLQLRRAAVTHAGDQDALGLDL